MSQVSEFRLNLTGIREPRVLRTTFLSTREGKNIHTQDRLSFLKLSVSKDIVTEAGMHS